MCTGPHTAGTAAHKYSLVSYATPLRICRNYAFWFSMLDETGFYAPSMAHNTLPCLPWQGISVFHGIILTISKSLRNRL